MSKIQKILIVYFVFFSQAVYADCKVQGGEFLGKRYSVQTDNLYLKLGQYICEETGSTMSKIDIPEHWKVNSIANIDGNMIIELAGKGKMVVSVSKSGPMQFEILDKGPGIGALPDQQLEQIWMKYGELRD